MPCRINFWILNLVEKDWSFSKEIFLWTVTINFTLQNFKTLEAALSSYQTILFYDLHIEMWSCLWMGNSSRSKFIHPRDFELWDSRDFPNFSNLYPIKCQEPCIFQSFCEVFTLYSSRENVWKVTVVQTSTGPDNSVQVFCAPKRLICWFVLLWRTIECPWNLPSMKTPNSLITFLSASSKSSTMQQKLLQKSTKLQIEGRKSFT